MASLPPILSKAISWKPAANLAPRLDFAKRFTNATALFKGLAQKLSLQNTAQLRGKLPYAGSTPQWKSLPATRKPYFGGKYRAPLKPYHSPGALALKPPKSTLPTVYEGPVGNVDARRQSGKSMADLATSTYRLRREVEQMRAATDTQLPGLLKELGALDENMQLTELGHAIIKHVDKGASTDPAVLASVRTLANELAVPLAKTGMSDKGAGEQLAGRLLQACRNFADELARLPQMKEDAKAIREALAKADTALASILDSLKQGQTPSDGQVRAFYNAMNKDVGARISEAQVKAMRTLTDVLPTTKERVQFGMAVSDIRSLTRHLARQLGSSDMMAMTTARDYLSSLPGNPQAKTPSLSATGHGPRFHERMNALFEQPGMTVDAALDSILGSANRTNAGVNARFDPKTAV
ncbi:hypothetical protein ACXIUT_16440 [Achromobacter denitrificans]